VRLAAGPWVGALALLTASGCATTAWAAGRPVAAEALACEESRLEPVVAHSYNLGPSDHVYRGCGHDAIVSCVSSPGGVMCRPTYVSER
jgi:hypothetical protein